MINYTEEIRELEEQIKNLQRQMHIETLGFEQGDPIYTVDNYGNTVSGTFDCVKKWQIDEIYQCSAFKTMKEAVFEVDRRKVIAELKYLSEKSGEKDNPWDGKSKHYYHMYDVSTKLIECTFSCYGKPATICFPTEETCRAAITAIGEERLKKYYLGVKEI